MKTIYLDNKILLLEGYKKEGTISSYQERELAEYKQIKELLSDRIATEIEQSEQLKTEVFTLANKLAIAGEGDAAVAMHRIHNRLY